MIRVLIVDDEIPVSQSLVGFLEDCDLDVAAAGSGEEALELAQKEHFDVAIVDLRLPGMSGEALIIKSKTLVPKLRFLIHTGSVDYRLSEELKRIGMRPEHVFLKPMDDLNELVYAIEKIARGEL